MGREVVRIDGFFRAPSFQLDGRFTCKTDLCGKLNAYPQVRSCPGGHETHDGFGISNWNVYISVRKRHFLGTRLMEE